MTNFQEALPTATTMSCDSVTILDILYRWIGEQDCAEVENSGQSKKR